MTPTRATVAQNNAESTSYNKFSTIGTYEDFVKFVQDFKTDNPTLYQSIENLYKLVGTDTPTPDPTFCPEGSTFDPVLGTCIPPPGEGLGDEHDSGGGEAP